MPTHDLVYVVAIGVCRIRVIESIWNITSILAKTSAVSTALVNEINARQNTFIGTGENRTKSRTRWSFVGSSVLQKDVIGCVAEDKLIQQGWRYGRSEASDQCESGSLEVSLDRWKGSYVCP